MARGDGLRVRMAPIDGVTGAALPRRIYFPAVTGDFEFSEGRQHTDYRTLSAGEYSVPGGGGVNGRDLRRFDLEIIAPQASNTLPWAVDGTANFEDVHSALTSVMRAAVPVDFLASIDLNGRSELACDVTIRSVSRVLRHAQSGLRYFAVSFTEWRDTSLRRRSTKAPASSLTAQLPARPELTATDTAESLALDYYGIPALSSIILSANGIPKWGRATALVKSARFKVGSYITIPEPSGYMVPIGKPLTITTTARVRTP